VPVPSKVEGLTSFISDIPPAPGLGEALDEERLAATESGVTSGKLIAPNAQGEIIAFNGY